MLEKSYLYATIFVVFCFVSFLTCPFKETEGKWEGLQWPQADVGAQPGGAGPPPALNRGETRNVGAVHPSSPSPLGTLRLPPKVSASPG